MNECTQQQNLAYVDHFCAVHFPADFHKSVKLVTDTHWLIRRLSTRFSQLLSGDNIFIEIFLVLTGNKKYQLISYKENVLRFVNFDNIRKFTMNNNIAICLNIYHLFLL